MDKKAIAGIQADKQFYDELKRLSNTKDFDAYTKLVVRTVAQKMTLVFTSDKITSWDDFCRARGEVTGLLYPLQEVLSAESIVNQLEEQLEQYYER